MSLCSVKASPDWFFSFVAAIVIEDVRTSLVEILQGYGCRASVDSLFKVEEYGPTL